MCVYVSGGRPMLYSRHVVGDRITAGSRGPSVQSEVIVPGNSGDSFTLRCFDAVDWATKK